MANAHGCVYNRIYIQRGLRHCLSSEDGQYQSLVRGMSDELRFPRFFYDHIIILRFGNHRSGVRRRPEWLCPTRTRVYIMKRLLMLLSLLPILVLCSCSKNNKNTTQTDVSKVEATVDSLAVALHEIDSLLNCGTLIHLDVYEIGKLKTVSVAVHKLTVADRSYSYVNFRKDCGGEYYYSWEDAMLLNEECKYFLNALNTIMQNNKRAVDHEERYAYSTKDDIAIYATSEKSGSNWTMRFSVDYKKSNSSITLSGDEMANLKELILKAQDKIEELK